MRTDGLESLPVVRRELLLVPQGLDDDPEARVGVVSQPVDTGNGEVAENIDGSDAVKDSGESDEDLRRSKGKRTNVESLKWTSWSCTKFQAAFSAIPFEAAVKEERSAIEMKEGGEGRRTVDLEAFVGRHLGGFFPLQGE